MSRTEQEAPRARAPRRSLVTEVLAAQLALTAAVGLIAIAGLAWTASSVVGNNLTQWAGQWAAELNELGAPFYRRNAHDAVLDVERFVAKYPEIALVTWYGPDGSVLTALDDSGVVEPPTAALDPALTRELAAKAGASPAFLLREEIDDRRFRLSGPIWTEAFEGDLLAADPTAASTVIELLGFVAIDLDFTAYRSALLPRLALASGVLLLLLTAAWGGGRLLLKRTLAPLSELEQPLAQLAAGETPAAFPASRHRELAAIVTALEDTMRTLRRREEHLLHLASHDPLTGLYNRHRLISEIDAELALCADKGRKSALLFVDLDQFKYVNDTCGHAAGDELLKRAADQIRYAVRREDCVARLGGDEFVVLLRDLTRRDAITLAEQVLDLMRTLQHVEQQQVFHLQCSIGLTMIQSGRYGAHELIAQADIACQAAKARGRNRVEVYSVAGKQTEQMAKDVSWMRSIREALETDAFVLHFQPLLHIASGTISHYEALLRLKTPRGLVGPQVFLPAAVRFGLMADIDAWVMEQGVRALAALGPASGLKLSVNLSSFAFENDGLAGRVRSLLREHALEGGRIVLEITEQLAVRFAASTDRQVTLLRDLGCRIAIDDFGTGYSSFSYLKRLPVDYLKIDGSFVKSLPRDKIDQSMVRMVGEVARAAGMQTVAEYVQNAATLSLLARYGIDYAQGFYVGRSVARLPGSADAEAAVV